MGSEGHFVYEIFEHQKPELFEQLLESNEGWDGVVVFVRMKDAVHSLAHELVEMGFFVESLHGNKKPEARELALRNFAEGKVQILVTTEASARGLEIEGMKVAVNYDFPEVVADFEGRKKAAEVVVDFLVRKDVKLRKKYEDRIGGEFVFDVLDGFTHDLHAVKVEYRNPGGTKRGGKAKSKPLQNRKKKWQPKKYGRN